MKPPDAETWNFGRFGKAPRSPRGLAEPVDSTASRHLAIAIVRASNRRCDRWARSRDGREVLSCAGIDPNERVVKGLMEFVAKGVRTSVALSREESERRHALEADQAEAASSAGEAGE